MPKTNYKSSSPYFETNQTSFYLDIYSDRPVEPTDRDLTITLTTRYHHRPDRLSSDLYGTPRFSWIFQRRNMDLIIHPIYDFVAGLQIKAPPRNFFEDF